ncbi:MFS transporter [Kaarinaea lacus]
MKVSAEDLYNRITGDEDARVCKDIPEKACNDQPRNFFAYLFANLCGKVADEIASAKLVIPWLFGLLGVPAAYTGFLIPIREAGVLLPQLAVAAAVRHVAIRKGIWLLGAALSALSLFGMAFAAVSLQGHAAGSAIIVMLVLFSLARGLCSVSAKDVLGKTISKSRRGILMGWSASLSGIAILIIGIGLSFVDLEAAELDLFAALLLLGGVLWIVASFAFASIREQPGATEGGGNALSVALQQIRLLITDIAFRRFVIARALLISVALAPPFYVLVAQSNSQRGLLGFGALIIANGLANGLSAPIWGYMADASSRTVMVIAALGAGLLGVFTYTAVLFEWTWAINEIGLAIIFFTLSVMHGGVRLGRKAYLVDMASGDNRAAYVAVSNTAIGILMLFGGLVGLLSDRLGATAVLLILAIISLAAAFYIKTLKEVSEAE